MAEEMSQARITHCAFGTITVDGVVFGRDLIIHDKGVIPNWWRKEGHRLHIEDLNEVVALAPELLLVGTGHAGQMRVPEATAEWLASKGIRLVVAATGETCDHFNRVHRSGRVVAALHLTC
jgi:hypothetical protein